MSEGPVQPLPLSKRFRKALKFAAKIHGGQGRKGTRVPYTAHLLAVTAIVLEHGGDEDQAIAALLHDAIEDQGGDVMRREIRDRFGDRVTEMVDDCTDAEVIPKPPWKERKLTYLAHIPAARADSLLVSMADKLHNSTTIVRDLRRQGPSVFKRFKGGRDGTLWYYRSLVEAFEARQPEGDARALLDELRLAVAELQEAVQALPDDDDDEP
jgi:(p)ppGpp synthase/HD superfamily hydrolase